MKTTTAWAIVFALFATACGEDPPIEPDPPMPASVNVAPDTVRTARYGEGEQLTARVIDQYGEIMDFPVKWSSTDTSVATVDKDRGMFYGWRTGSAGIIATANTVADTATAVVTLVERDALTAIYDALGGDGWKENGGWLSDAPLNTWHGITTNADGDVTGVGLVANGLKGTLPIDVTYLESLEFIDMGFNDSIGGVVFPEFGQMEHLRGIGLHHGLFTGTIPPELANLDLEVLDLHWNELSGEFPEWVGNEPNLKHIALWGNNLSGPLPESIGNSNAVVFYIHQSPLLTGPLPRSMMEMDSLAYFWWFGTGMCSPPDDEFQEWLESLPVHNGGEPCEEPGDGFRDDFDGDLDDWTVYSVNARIIDEALKLATAERTNEFPFLPHVYRDIDFEDGWEIEFSMGRVDDHSVVGTVMVFTGERPIRILSLDYDWDYDEWYVDVYYPDGWDESYSGSLDLDQDELHAPAPHLRAGSGGRGCPGPVRGADSPCSSRRLQVDPEPGEHHDRHDQRRGGVELNDDISDFDDIPLGMVRVGPGIAYTDNDNWGLSYGFIEVKPYK